MADEPLGDEIGVLDEVGAMANHPGHQCRAFRRTRAPEHPPFVLLATAQAGGQANRGKGPMLSRAMASAWSGRTAQ